MRPRTFLCSLAISSLGCFSLQGCSLSPDMNPFNISRQCAAIVRGNRITTGNGTHIITIYRVDEKVMVTGPYWFGPNIAFDELVELLVPSGERVIVFRTIYSIRDSGYVASSKVTATLQANHTYVPNGKIVDDEVQVWLEDAEDGRVSEIVRPDRVEVSYFKKRTSWDFMRRSSSALRSEDLRCSPNEITIIRVISCGGESPSTRWVAECQGTRYACKEDFSGRVVCTPGEFPDP